MACNLIFILQAVGINARLQYDIYSLRPHVVDIVQFLRVGYAVDGIVGIIVRCKIVKQLYVFIAACGFVAVLNNIPRSIQLITTSHKRVDQHRRHVRVKTMQM